MKVAINNGKIWDGERFSEGSVLAENGVITEMGAREYSADFVFDARGNIISAGLVDVHTHLYGVAPDIYGTPADSTCLPFGVTAAADAGSVMGGAERLAPLGVKVFIFVNAEFDGEHVDFTRSEKLLKQYGDNAIGVKFYYGSDKLDGVKPLEEVCAFARSHGLKVMIHSTGSPVPMADLARTLGAGDILTHAFHGGKSNASEDDFNCLRLAKKRGVIVDAGMAGHVHTDFKVFRGAIEAGVLPDTISTDVTRLSAFSRGGRYGMTMCMSIARHLGMKEEDVLRAVTSAAASALGKENELGSLKIGRKADVAVIGTGESGAFSLTDAAGNNVSSATGYECLLTLLNGRVVYRK